MNKSKLALISMMSALSMTAFANNNDTSTTEQLTIKIDFDVTSCVEKPNQMPHCNVLADNPKNISFTLSNCQSAGHDTFCSGNYNTSRQSGAYTFSNHIDVTKHTDGEGNTSYLLNANMGTTTDHNLEISLQIELSKDGKLINSIHINGTTLSAPQPDGSLFTYHPYLRMDS